MCAATSRAAAAARWQASAGGAKALVEVTTWGPVEPAGQQKLRRTSTTATTKTVRTMAGAAMAAAALPGVAPAAAAAPPHSLYTHMPSVPLVRRAGVWPAPHTLQEGGHTAGKRRACVSGSTHHSCSPAAAGRRQWRRQQCIRSFPFPLPHARRTHLTSGQMTFGSAVHGSAALQSSAVTTTGFSVARLRR